MLTRKKFFAIWLLGLMSGFTLMISGNTLNFWLAEEKIDIKTIGIFSLISLPYAINFVWAPIFDSIKLPVLHNSLGKRLSWILLVQLVLAICIFIIGFFDPKHNLKAIAFVAIMIAFLASAQDTILGAIRTEMIPSEKQGEISGIYSFGYRLGMLLSNYGAIYISQFIDWSYIYFLFGFFVALFPALLISGSSEFAYNNEDLQGVNVDEQQKDLSGNKRNKLQLIQNILSPIGSAKYILLVLLFLVLYKIPDNFISVTINPFLLHVGYDAGEISVNGKLIGMLCATFGGLVAGYLMKGKNIHHCLIFFGALHGLSHFMFIVQEYYGKNINLLLSSTVLEGTTGGMAMTAYIAFIATLCKGKFRATQYAFFSSMMGFARSVFPALSGYIVASYGWYVFYIITIIATLPPLFLINYIHKIKQGE